MTRDDLCEWIASVRDHEEIPGPAEISRYVDTLLAAQRAALIERLQEIARLQLRSPGPLFDAGFAAGLKTSEAAIRDSAARDTSTEAENVDTSGPHVDGVDRSD